MAITFGWSVGDVVCAIKFLTELVKAFDSAKGASSKYRDSVQFLNGLILVVGRLKVYCQTIEERRIGRDDQSFQGDYMVQIGVIMSSISHLETQLNGQAVLGAEKLSLQKIAKTIKSVWSDAGLAHNYVQELKAKISDHVSILQMLITLETR
jgi:hypothetical protein